MSSSRRRDRWQREPQPLGRAIDGVLKNLAPPGTPVAPAKTVGGVFARWDEAVGPQVAAHARPVRLHEGTLLVEVDEPGWATQLRFLVADLLQRLAAAAGPGVTAIEWRVKRGS